jgi:hypothetical protein
VSRATHVGDCRTGSTSKSLFASYGHAPEQLPELCTRAEGSSSIAPRKFALQLRIYHALRLDAERRRHFIRLDVRMPNAKRMVSLPSQPGTG